MFLGFYRLGLEVFLRADFNGRLAGILVETIKCGVNLGEMIVDIFDCLARGDNLKVCSCVWSGLVFDIFDCLAREVIWKSGLVFGLVLGSVIYFCGKAQHHFMFWYSSVEGQPHCAEC